MCAPRPIASMTTSAVSSRWAPPSRSTTRTPVTRPPIRCRRQLGYLVAAENRHVADRLQPPPDMAFQKWPARHVNRQRLRLLRDPCPIAVSRGRRKTNAAWIVLRRPRPGAPSATSSSRIPGKSSSKICAPRASRTCTCRPCGTPRRTAGSSGNSSRSTTVTVSKKSASTLAASNPPMLAPRTTARWPSRDVQRFTGPPNSCCAAEHASRLGCHERVEAGGHRLRAVLIQSSR